MSGVVRGTVAGVTFFAVLVLGVAADINIVIVLIGAFLISGLMRRYL